VNAPRVPGPREADLLRLLANVRPVEGSGGWLTLVDGKVAECRALPWNGRYARAFRIAGGDWINQRDALKWAREQDERQQPTA
jgi:hypothetical protein